MEENNNTIDSLFLESYKNWNLVREATYNIIYEDFIKLVLEKGLKEHRKALIRNNQNYFTDFMKRKIRYFISELIKKEDIKKSLDEMYSKYKKENSEKIFSDELINFLSAIILSNNKHKQQILDYIQEFLNFSIVF